MNLHKFTDRNFYTMLAGDAVLISLAYLSAYLIRFDLGMPDTQLKIFLHSVHWIVIVKLIGFYFFDLYRGMWRYTGVHDIANIAKACLTTTVGIMVLILLIFGFQGLSRSIFLIDGVMTFCFISGFRVGIRLLFSRPANGFRRRLFSQRDPNARRILILGAGSAGEKLLREIFENDRLKYEVVGFIDDEPSKLKDTIHRVPVLGSVQDLSRLVAEHRIEEIIIAVSSATAVQMRRFVDYCKSTGAVFKTLPGIGDLVEGKVTASAIREVRYQDLLGRPPVRLENEVIGVYLTGKRVMVTGAAGSIGSELCRQIAKFRPEKLILVERNESGLYDIDLELRAKNPGLVTVPILGAIQNKLIMGQVFKEHRPHTVFHAAAYKHVPMMEMHPWEAVFNNVIGTRTIIELCNRTGVARCVVISTDKAVRPTNVMGATKRMIERITQCYAADSRCRFMAVRFGNVLGSAGSVLPLFKRQIAAGGPVTVTHPEVTRYFMTIPEACSLVLQAGGIGIGNEIFVLKMGTPTRIDTMARDLITLSGFTPDVDIKIEYSGLRPGEKLYEELITEGEDIHPTAHEDIMLLRANDCLSMTELIRHLDELVRYAEKRDGVGIRRKLCDVVPEYAPQMPGEGNEGNVIRLGGKGQKSEIGDRRSEVGDQTARGRRSEV